MKPRLIVTLGDPAGIGPEVVAQALQDPRVRRACSTHVVGSLFPKRKLGRPSAEGGQSAILALEKGLALLRDKQADGLVTAPVSKESFALAHYGYPGHTEWLAAESRVKHVAMMMVAGSMRTILLTRHIPLKDVSKSLTRAIIIEAARLGQAFLDHYVSRPAPMALCGLNPHAGDQGLIGREELTQLRPAVMRLLKEGMKIVGPLPADAVFRDMAKGRFSLALAAYHDQGMIPLKVFAPDCMVNVTLGLPFVRTSPAHGTAYDIAGKGIAKAQPMIEAILLAARMCSA